MPLLRSLILAVVPRSVGEALERESRLWMLICPQCGGEQSFWDIGGIRYKAVGNPRKLIHCAKCGWTWHRVEKKAAPLDAQVDLKGNTRTRIPHINENLQAHAGASVVSCS